MDIETYRAVVALVGVLFGSWCAMAVLGWRSGFVRAGWAALSLASTVAFVVGSALLAGVVAA